MSSGSIKRKAEDQMSKAAAKVAKPLASIFLPRSSTVNRLKWHNDLEGTCLHGTAGEPSLLPKCALFDLDGTLIHPKEGRKHPRGADDWEWWHPNVKRKLNAIKDEYTVIFVSNQGGLQKNEKRKTDWRSKIAQLANQLPEVPFRVYGASGYDKYRKPLPGIFQVVQSLFAEKDIVIDQKASFYVGDAAGRKGDHSHTDRLFALNTDLLFFTPEQYFLNANAPQIQPLDPRTYFNPALLPKDLPPWTPTHTPLAPPPATSSPSSPLEIVIFVGYPGSGKTSFYRRYFETSGYTHVNQDTLGTKQKCLKEVEQQLGEGKSCVVDNTNRNKETRAEYVQLAKKMKVPIRCMYFTASRELCKHNNIYRAFLQPHLSNDKQQRRKYLPNMAFIQYGNNHEPPALDEGFQEVRSINFVFEGDAENRRLWDMVTDIEWGKK